jgi:hypothetical protein
VERSKSGNAAEPEGLPGELSEKARSLAQQLRFDASQLTASAPRAAQALAATAEAALALAQAVEAGDGSRGDVGPRENK